MLVFIQGMRILRHWLHLVRVSSVCSVLHEFPFAAQGASSLLRGHV